MDVWLSCECVRSRQLVCSSWATVFPASYSRTTPRCLGPLGGLVLSLGALNMRDMGPWEIRRDFTLARMAKVLQGLVHP